jgi:glutathione synthase/RimK-type ligase-like ATP-grasp enzyme
MKLTVWGQGSASKALAKALGVKRNMITADTIIRYHKLDPHPRARKEINSAEAIRKASNKYQSLVIMKDAGLRIPKVSRNKSDMDNTKTVFGRDFYHSKGTDIVIYRPGETIKQHEYYIEYMKPRSEYRYHVAFGKVILPTKKILAEGQTDDSLIRNHQDGKWKQVTCVETPRFSETCIKAIKCLGLDFGAVDFLNVKGEAVVLEVNTAPGLEVENRLEAYSKAIRENVR